MEHLVVLKWSKTGQRLNLADLIFSFGHGRGDCIKHPFLPSNINLALFVKIVLAALNLILGSHLNRRHFQNRLVDLQVVENNWLLLKVSSGRVLEGIALLRSYLLFFCFFLDVQTFSYYI